MGVGVLFWIGWEESGVLPAGERRGRINASSLNESFDASLSVWAAGDYEVQWREGIKRVLGGEAVSALLTNLGRSEDGVFSGVRWAMYRVDEVVFLREQLVLRETVPGFDPADPYQSILERDPDLKVSEWAVPLSALRDFLV